MMFRRVLAGLCVAVVVGCSSSTESGLSANSADIVGTIQQAIAAADGSGQVRLAIGNLKRGPAGTTGTAFVTVNPGTPITFASGQTATVADLKVGVVIYANIDPAGIDTFPPQYAATEIKIPSQ